MSKNTTDELEDSIKHCFYTYNMDTSAGGMDEEKALNYQVDAIKALISNLEKLARIDELERPKSLVLGMNESFDFKAGFEEAVDQMERADELRLATLRKELDGGAEMSDRVKINLPGQSISVKTPNIKTNVSSVINTIKSVSRSE